MINEVVEELPSSPRGEPRMKVHTRKPKPKREPEPEKNNEGDLGEAQLHEASTSGPIEELANAMDKVIIAFATNENEDLESPSDDFLRFIESLLVDEVQGFVESYRNSNRS